MTTLAHSTLLATLLGAAPRLLNRLFSYWRDFSTGIEEARAMALLYQDLAALSDRELAACGLKREDIPRAVLAVLNDR
jgi:uncharacterized protein YjiS (DUF1127 family)